MTELPDIDTADVSFIGYYNVIDQGGVSTIDPETALTADRIVEYTLYDNGWEADFEFRNKRLATARMKSDGWVAVYFDRTENLSGTTSEDGDQFLRNERDRGEYQGPFDIINNWNAWDSYDTGSGTEVDRTYPNVEFDYSEMHAAIADIVDNLDSTVDFDYEDVGIYNYQHEAASATTFLWNYIVGSHSADYVEDGTPYGRYLYTDGTDILEHLVVGCGTTTSNDNSRGPYGNEVSFEEQAMINTGGADQDDVDQGVQMGCFDVLAEELAPDAGTEYESYTDGDANTQNPHYTPAWINHLVVWG